MTESEAIGILESIMYEYRKKKFGEQALVMAINALEKQIPKKPIFDFNSSDTSSKFHCTCGTSINVYHEIGTMDNNDAPNYCYYCGNKIDWSNKD